MPAIGGAITSSVLLSIPRGRAARWNGPIHHYLQTAGWSKCSARGVQSKSGNSHWSSLKLLLSPLPGALFRSRSRPIPHLRFFRAEVTLNQQKSMMEHLLQSGRKEGKVFKMGISLP
jgi:hypothetical protein